MRAVARYIAAVVVACLACENTNARQSHSFRFDGEALLDAPLRFEFSRPVPALLESGAVVGEGVPRFRPLTLLSPLPKVEVISGSTNSSLLNIVAAGVDSDGVTPVWVVADYSNGRLITFVGELTSLTMGAATTASYGTAGYMYPMLYNASKGGMIDAMASSIDASPNEAWRPVSGTVCHGMIVLQCNVGVPAGQGWVGNRIGFMTCRIADLAGPAPLWWRRHALSDALTPAPGSVALGAFWTLQNWWSTRRDGTRPTRGWITACDYHSAPLKDGGTFFLFSLDRSAPDSTDWVVGPVVELPGRWHDPALRSHTHSVGLTRFGEEGLLLLGSRGDGIGSAANWVWTIEDESRYSDGAIAADGGSNWFRAGPEWSGPIEVHGHIDPSLANHQANRKSNQFIGIAPGPEEGTFLCGSDEASEALWVTNDLSAGPVPLAFDSRYEVMQTLPVLAAGDDGPWRHYLCFHITSTDPNSVVGDYVAQLAPSQFDPDKRTNQRVLYSPNGVAWTQVWSHTEGEHTTPWIVDGRIWIGSYGKNRRAGIRSIPVPAMIEASPLTVAPGRINAVSQVGSVADVGEGVSAQVITQWPVGIDPPPCSGPAYRVVNQPPTPAGGASKLGRFRLATDIPPEIGEVSVKIWVRLDTPQESGRTDSLAIMGRFNARDESWVPSLSAQSGRSASIDVATSGRWMPVILTTDMKQWAMSDTWSSGGASLDLILTQSWDVISPLSFYFAVESVSWGASPPYASTATGELPDERAEIRGFEVTGDWTMFLSAMVPHASWDNSLASGTAMPKPLLSVVSETGASWVEILADRQTSSITLRAGGTPWHGASVSLPDFNWYPGSPLHLAISYCAKWRTFILRASIGNGPLTSSPPMIALLDSQPATLRLGSGDGTSVTSIDVFGGAVVGGQASSDEAELVLRELPMLRGSPVGPLTGDCEDGRTSCPADIDGSGFMDTSDFDTFVIGFEAGLAWADFDGSGFVDTVDFDVFVLAFEAGC